MSNSRPSLDGSVVMGAGGGRVMVSQISPVVRAKSWTLLALPDTSGRERDPWVGSFRMLTAFLALVLAGLFNIAPRRRIVARLIVIAVWREEGRAETQPIRDIYEASEE